MVRVKSIYNDGQVAAYRRGEKLPMVKCAVPAGRTSYTIYAVCLREHPNVVKVGQTSKWAARRRVYEFWNLSKGDAIERAMRFVVNDEFVDLKRLESHILAAVGRAFPLHYGAEWFRGDFDEVVRLMDRVMAETGLTYEIE